MNTKRWILFLLIFLTTQAKAECPLDIYGTKQILADKICQEFEKDINEFVKLSSRPSHILEVNEERERLRKKIIYGVQEMGQFIYVNLAAINYFDPEDSQATRLHITIDVVEASDENRLKFKMPPFDIVDEANELMNSWEEYETIGREIMMTHPNEMFQDCPVQHCIFGFEHPKLKKYESYFIDEVQAHKSELIKILQMHRDPIKRGNAAFLLAHLKDSNELSDILINSIDDSHRYVRNNVMRILGSMLETKRLNHVPLDKIMNALDFPDVTDRNKALYVILGLVKDETYAKYFAEHAKGLLIEQLKLKQPNIHDHAYQILCLISGKQFGERDYEAWEQWAMQA